MPFFSIGTNADANVEQPRDTELTPPTDNNPDKVLATGAFVILNEDLPSVFTQIRHSIRDIFGRKLKPKYIPRDAKIIIHFDSDGETYNSMSLMSERVNLFNEHGWFAVDNSVNNGRAMYFRKMPNKKNRTPWLHSSALMQLATKKERAITSAHNCTYVSGNTRFWEKEIIFYMIQVENKQIYPKFVFGYDADRLNISDVATMIERLLRK